MLQALLESFAQVKSVEIIIMLDWRVCKKISTGQLTRFIITAEHKTLMEFERLARQCDAVWPIAPEFDGILQGLCEKVEALNKILLTSSAVAVALAGNKWHTYQTLVRHHIATVPTRLLAGQSIEPGTWIIKAVDGAGCQDSFVVSDRETYQALVTARCPDRSAYIIQPLLEGKKTSLSCLFKQGRGWLISINLQHFQLFDQQFQLTGIQVNYSSHFDRYSALVGFIAEAFPTLWGYAGVDLIETNKAILVLEINPRLTTSFAGIQAARGINVCANVLELIHGDPKIEPLCNQVVKLSASLVEGL